MIVPVSAAGRAGLALAFVLSLAGPPAAAQSTNAAIEGTVTDSGGAVLPGVTITVTNEATGLTRTTVTGERGAYRVSELPPGRYQLRAELPGFAAIERSGIVLGLGSTFALNFELALASIQESVTVTGAAPIVETSQKSLETNISPA